MFLCLCFLNRFPLLKKVDMEKSKLGQGVHLSEVC